jgi:hypothetical protein
MSCGPTHEERGHCEPTIDDEPCWGTIGLVAATYWRWRWCGGGGQMVPRPSLYRWTPMGQPRQADRAVAHGHAGSTAVGANGGRT